MPYAVGLELGLASIAAAVADGSTVAVVPTTADVDRPETPAVVYAAHGQFATGADAERRAIGSPDRLATGILNLVAERAPVLIDGATHPADAVLGTMVHHVLAHISGSYGGPPQRVTLTYPTHWTPDQVAALADALRPVMPAGTMQLRPNLVAAAIGYGSLNPVDDGTAVALVDVGAAAFEVAVVGRYGNEILLLTQHVEHGAIGGQRFDDALLAIVDRATDGAVSALDMTSLQGQITLARLRRACRLAKEKLSTASRTDITAYLPGGTATVRVSRTEFEAAIRPELEVLVGAVVRALRSAPTPPRALLLTGGSAQIPLLQRLVEAIKDGPEVVTSPHAAARGAAIVGAPLGAAAGPAVGQAAPPPPGAGAGPPDPAAPADTSPSATTPAAADHARPPRPSAPSPADPAGTGNGAGGAGGAAGGEAGGRSPTATASPVTGPPVNPRADGPVPQGQGLAAPDGPTSAAVASLVGLTTPTNGSVAGAERPAPPAPPGAAALPPVLAHPAAAAAPAGTAQEAGGAPSWPPPPGQTWPVGPGPTGAWPAAPGDMPAEAWPAPAPGWPGSSDVAGGAQLAPQHGYPPANGPAPTDHWPASASSSPRPAGRRVLMMAALAGVAGLVLLVVYLFTAGPWGTGGAAADPDPPAAGPAPDAGDSATFVVPIPPSAGPAAPPDGAAGSTTAPSVDRPTVVGVVSAGTTPGFAAVSPSGGQVYIANRAAGQASGGLLTVLDAATDIVTGRIPIPGGPAQYLAFSPDGSRLYVSIFTDSDRGPHQVAVVDTASNTVTASIDVGTRPYALATSPDGSQVWVPNHDSGTVSIIDTRTNTLVADVRVPANPHWVAFDPDGEKAYTANHESNLIAVLDTATRSVVAQIPVGLSPHSVAVHPTQPLVATVNYDGHSISLIDTVTETVVGADPACRGGCTTLAVGRHPQDLAWSADGAHLYVTNVHDHTVSVIDVVDRQVTATVPVGRTPTSVVVTPAGDKAYVTDLDDGTVHVLKLTG